MAAREPEKVYWPYSEDSYSYANSNFRSLLLQLSNNLTRRELQALKFLCGDVVSRYRLETIISDRQGFLGVQSDCCE